MYQVVIKLTDSDKERGVVVLNVETKSQARKIKEATKNEVTAVVSKTVEL